MKPSLLFDLDDTLMVEERAAVAAFQATAGSRLLTVRWTLRGWHSGHASRRASCGVQHRPTRTVCR